MLPQQLVDQIGRDYTLKRLAPLPARAGEAGHAASLGRYREACREVEATRLLLAALARRHGPMA